MAGTVDGCGRRGTTVDMTLRRQAATAARPRRGDAPRGTSENPGGRDWKIKPTLMKPQVSLP